MKPAVDVDELRQQAILSARAGFPFLLVFAFVWLAAAGLSSVLPPALAPWAYLVLGLPAGTVLLCGALAVRSHARAIWRSTQRDAGRRTVPLNVQ